VTNNKMYPNNQFFSRKDPLVIKRLYNSEEIDCSFVPPMPTASKIQQSVRLVVTTEEWPMRLIIKSDFGEERSCDIFVDDEFMFALADAYVRLREHYEDGEYASGTR